MSESILSKYVKLEDEIDMRLRYKQVLKLQGQVGFCLMMGEMARCLEIANEVLDEHRKT